MASRSPILPFTGVTAAEAEQMAMVLEGQHGVHAAGVAEFLSDLHAQGKDRQRGGAWKRVAEIVKGRERQRLTTYDSVNGL